MEYSCIIKYYNVLFYNSKGVICIYFLNNIYSAMLIRLQEYRINYDICVMAVMELNFITALVL